MSRRLATANTDLAGAASSWPEGSSAPPSVSPSNRRAYRRLSVREFEWLRAARLKYGPDVRVIDVSAGGLALETKHALKPHSKVVFELTGPTGSLLVPARVLRSQIVSLNGVALYRSGCAFQNPLELSGLRSDVSTLRMPSRDSVQIDLALPGLLERHGPPTDSVLAELEALHRRTISPVSVPLTDAASSSSDPRLRRYAGYLVELLHEWNLFVSA